eukprot:TRINITY_DN4533_c0_g1_i4.p1 TRINITY_DN4533_c0_g1~~TRINITY_DN4533_c0_g1_i4.p1  ORF type:complete len:299 (-),score=-40.46 TRINITY_DN4533_c0_g1_i4:115-1011(-)
MYTLGVLNLLYCMFIDIIYVYTLIKYVHIHDIYFNSTNMVDVQTHYTIYMYILQALGTILCLYIRVFKFVYSFLKRIILNKILQCVHICKVYMTRECLLIQFVCMYQNVASFINFFANISKLKHLKITDTFPEWPINEFSFVDSSQIICKHIKSIGRICKVYTLYYIYVYIYYKHWVQYRVYIYVHYSSYILIIRIILNKILQCLHVCKVYMTCECLLIQFVCMYQNVASFIDYFANLLKHLKITDTFPEWPINEFSFVDSSQIICKQITSVGCIRQVYQICLLYTICLLQEREKDKE